MKLVFLFATLISLALAADIDSAEPKVAIYSSSDFTPYTKVSMREAVAILCRELRTSLMDCNDFCDQHFSPIFICPEICENYRNNGCSG